nr:hypothetical protein Iba_chr05aCG0310 [Ipomoea batatas]
MDGDQSKRPEKSRIVGTILPTSKLHGTISSKVQNLIAKLQWNPTSMAPSPEFTESTPVPERAQNAVERDREPSNRFGYQGRGLPWPWEWPRLMAEVVHLGSTSRGDVLEEVENHLHPKYKIGIMAFCAGKRSRNPTKGLMNTCGRSRVTLFKDTLLETRAELLSTVCIKPITKLKQAPWECRGLLKLGRELWVENGKEVENHIHQQQSHEFVGNYKLLQVGSSY